MISVCLATYMGEKFISEQMTSVIGALKFAGIQDFEILVSDDGSLDKTRALVEGFDCSRVSLIEGPRSGVVKNFEHLLLRAQGDIVFLCDQDDIWSNDKVRRSLDELMGYDLIVSDAKIVNSNRSVISESFFESRGSGVGLIKNLYKNSYLGCCMCFRRSKLYEFKCLPFPNDIPMHDWWLGLKFEVAGKVKFVKEPLVFYRRHGGNVSPSSEKSHYSLWQQIRWRWILVKNLLKGGTS